MSKRPGPDAGQEQLAERRFGRHRVEQHGYGGWQQNAERAAGRDEAGGEPRRIAALAHLWNAGGADGRAGGGRRAGHGGEQAAGQHVGDAEPAGDAMKPGVQRHIEVAAGIGPADRRALQDEQRDGENDDVRHLLIDVLRDRTGRGRRHEQDHEGGGDNAERKGDGDP